MGNQISTAQYAALGSFVVNFGTQTYGMLIKPNMKDIADANHYAFSPNPMFIAAFFSGQTILQAYWIRRLFLLKNTRHQTIEAVGGNRGNMEEMDRQIAADEAVTAAVEYAPIFALGNLCIAGWLIFWLKENFWAAQVLVTINTAAHLYAVARLPPLTANSPRLLYATHFVAKSIAGIGLLDFIDNGGVATRYRAPPTQWVQAFTFAFFPLAAALAGPFFGSTIAYDILAVYVGQRNVLGAAQWGTRLGWTALATAGVVGVKAFLSL
ncbi:hypothetical protein BDW22DRAFT_1320281 [Trametopsis cervina]|nr:hypothetical protein BDW22DRAFT_1320281 [Trametopsis cervina]